MKSTWRVANTNAEGKRNRRKGVKGIESTERSRRFHVNWKPHKGPKVPWILMGFLPQVLGETTITTGVARILSYIKEGIKIQVEGVNLHGIELRVGWNIMWKVGISFSCSSWKRCDKSSHRRRQERGRRDFKEEGYRRQAWGFLNCEGDQYLKIHT